ncbi:MAG: transposase, partial [Chloroflexota bacterium]
MDVLGRYPILWRAWSLKEAFREWYRAPSRAEAKEQGPAAFRALLPMLRDWRGEILNYFDYPYTNGF